MQPDFERLLAVVRRELGAKDASVLESDLAQEPLDPEREIRCRLPDGRWLVAAFDAPPQDIEARQRRLEMLASTFDVLAAEAPVPRSRPPVVRSLQEELRALCARAAAVNAVVVDANSPVVWGAAEVDGLGQEWPVAGEPAPSGTGAPGASTARVDGPSLAALAAVRHLGALAALRKGRHLRHVEREGEGPFLAHSFASIYLLVIVFDGPFDELRAERAATESLPRIEQLVMALPPLDPAPSAGAGAIAMRRPRRT